MGSLVKPNAPTGSAAMCPRPGGAHGIGGRHLYHALSCAPLGRGVSWSEFPVGASLPAVEPSHRLLSLAPLGPEPPAMDNLYSTEKSDEPVGVLTPRPSPMNRSAMSRSIPTGVHHSAQGCEARATLGRADESLSNPNGVVSRDRTGVLQPRWGWRSRIARTRGSLADSATAGLNDGIPLGYRPGPGDGFGRLSMRMDPHAYNIPARASFP